jgi:hypothetical protein
MQSSITVNTKGRHWALVQSSSRFTTDFCVIRFQYYPPVSTLQSKWHISVRYYNQNVVLSELSSCFLHRNIMRVRNWKSQKCSVLHRHICLSVCTHVTNPETVNGLSWHFILGSFAKKLSKYSNFHWKLAEVTSNLWEDVHVFLRAEVTGWEIYRLPLLPWLRGIFPENGTTAWKESSLITSLPSQMPLPRRDH